MYNCESNSKLCANININFEMFKFSNNFNIINFEYKNIYILPFNFNSANNNKIINNLANNINRSSYKAVRTYCASKRTTPNNKSFEDIPGPWPSLPLIGTGWQYMKFCMSNILCSFYKQSNYVQIILLTRYFI